MFRVKGAVMKNKPIVVLDLGLEHLEEVLQKTCKIITVKKEEWVRCLVSERIFITKRTDFELEAIEQEFGIVQVTDTITTPALLGLIKRCRNEPFPYIIKEKEGFKSLIGL
jgi:hypothetical protein